MKVIARTDGKRLFCDDPRLKKHLARLAGKGINSLILEVKQQVKTTQQVRTIYALMPAWQDTGAHSAPVFLLDRDSFKMWCKWFYGTENRQGFTTEQKKKGLKSLADYDKYEMQEFINSVLAAIQQSGAGSAKLNEIYAGIEQEKKCLT